jgi:spermidine synthase
MIPVEDRRSQFGAITIYRSRSTGAVVYNQQGCDQSEADGNGVSLASYVHALYGLILQAQAEDVLMIGCGGGTLGTMLAAGKRNVTIVDVNPDAFSLARRYFGLPRKVVCHVADGSAYLVRETKHFDAVVLDAFHGDVIPDHFFLPDFFRCARLRLAAGGCFFANIHVRDDNDQTADTMARSMAQAWDDARLLDAPGWCNRNAIVMAGRVADLVPPALQLCPSEAADQIAFELGTMQFRSWDAS